MNPQERVVVVPVDFSEQSIIALEQAVSLSTYFQTDVIILHVRDKRESHFEDSQVIEENLKTLQLKYEKPNVRINYVVKDGIPYKVILEFANAINAVFIIMGVNSGPKFKRKLIGDTVLRVVRESTTQVITIKGKEHRVGCKNIVFPLDLTEETTQKVANAIEFAKFGTCAIRILSVLFSTDDYVVNKLVRQMEEVRNLIESYEVECTAELIKATKGEETTAQVIIDYAEKVEGDLIMIMTQQEESEEEKILGPTAEEIIIDSEIPVLSIIPQDKRAKALNANKQTSQT
jgi:nucleotide-binding universal stress UspA family protein